jgi:Rrf2 family protein
MKMSSAVEWALHCCVTLSQARQPVPATRLAELHGTPPAYLAKQLQALSRASIVHSTAGQAGGYRLTRPAAVITALDVVEAIGEAQQPFRCTEIRQRGPLAVPAEQCTRACAIARAMATAHQAWRDALAHISIADLAVQIDTDSGRTALADIRRWLTTGG